MLGGLYFEETKSATYPVRPLENELAGAKPSKFQRMSVMRRPSPDRNRV